MNKTLKKVSKAIFNSKMMILIVIGILFFVWYMLNRPLREIPPQPKDLEKQLKEFFQTDITKQLLLEKLEKKITGEFNSELTNEQKLNKIKYLLVYLKSQGVTLSTEILNKIDLLGGTENEKWRTPTGVDLSNLKKQIKSDIKRAMNV